MALEVIPLASDVMRGRFDLYAALVRSLERNREALRGGDILVVSTKYASNSEDRILDLHGVRASEHARLISRRFALGESTAEVILRESGRILGGTAGFVIATSQSEPSPVLPLGRSAMMRGAGSGPSRRHMTGGAARMLWMGGCILAPNAGIDASNVKKGHVILYPSAPYETAEMLRRHVLLGMGVSIGVILADSRLMPARTGTSGVAVGCSGLSPVTDCRSELDLDGNPLKVTFQADADNLASIANHVMGEGAESRPLAIVRGSGAGLRGGRAPQSASTVTPEMCVYVRGLSNALDD